VIRWSHEVNQLQTVMNALTAEFDHFVEAQNPVYDEVVEELTRGRKRSHWMWFIFPQIKGLGHSSTSQRFAIQSLEQARRYADHVLLGRRLRECTRLVLYVEGRSVSEIFGYPDDLKFHSSMTSFAKAVPEEPLFDAALEKYFVGKRDAKTLEILERG
jgi:uncharacterized protein (DUF1810 family)